MLRVAVIGAGRIGHVHSQTLAKHPRATLALVCDPLGSAASDLASIAGARSCLESSEVFGDPNIDAVVIGSPSNLHAEQVLAAARSGKAVMCEKPIATSVEEALSLKQELDKFDHPPIMVGFQRRFDPSMRKAHDLVTQGRIGAVEQLRIDSRDPSPPPAQYVASSGGIFMDAAIHDFDMARFFMGEIKEVTAVGSNFQPEIEQAGDFDATAIILRAENGGVVQITNNRHCAAGYDQRMEIHGATGALMVDNERSTTVSINDANQSAAQDTYLDYFLERYAAAYRNELSAFIEATQSGAHVSPGIDDGIAALVLAEAAAKAAVTGRTVQVG